MTYRFDVMPSGLRVASEPLLGMESVTIAFSVNVGARHESAAQHGISHLLEHMAFKGTPTRSAQQIAEAFDAIGGHINAYTSHEQTVYYAKVLQSHLPVAVEILCDILQHSLFDEEELTREKQVVLQELAMHEDTPDDVIFDIFQEAIFSGQSLGRNILGTQERIIAHSSDDLRQFVRHHYQPKQIVVSAAGAVDHDRLLSLLQVHLHMEDAGSKPVREAGSYVGTSRSIVKPLEQVQLVLGFNAITIMDERLEALQLLSTILGGGMSSRLFQEVREKRGLVYTIQSFHAPYDDCGVFGIYAATTEKELAVLLPIIGQQLRLLAADMSEQELQRAKEQQRSHLLMSRESSSTMAEWIGRHLLTYGEYRNANQLLARSDAVSLNEVKALAEELIDFDRMTIAALGNLGTFSAEQMTDKIAA